MGKAPAQTPLQAGHRTQAVTKEGAPRGREEASRRHPRNSFPMTRHGNPGCKGDVDGAVRGNAHAK